MGSPSCPPRATVASIVPCLERPGLTIRHITIETDRLSLIPLEPEDAAEMVAVLADPTLYAYIGGGPPTLDELSAVYRRWVAGSPRDGERWHNWVIRQRSDGWAVGHLQVTVIEAVRSADMGWMVGTAWQGRGYATESARALVGWLEAQSVTSITALIHPANLASARVAERAGLEQTADIVDGEVAWRRVAPPG